MDDRSTASLWRLAAYSLPAIGLAMLTGPILVFLPNYYATEIGLSLGAVGGVFFLARCWDAVSDLMVGVASDKTRSRWGRRAPWVALGAPVLCLAVYMVCLPPDGVGTLYLLVCLVAVYTAWTAVQIPYTAWGAAISNDYKIRSRVFGLREACTVIGSLATVVVPFLVTGVPSPPLDQVIAIIGIAVIGVLVAAIPLALAFGPPARLEPPATSGAWQAIRRLPRNAPFLRSLAINLLFTSSLMTFTAGILFYLNAVLELEEVFLQLLLLQQLATIASVPGVLWLADRLGRHRALAAGCLGVGGGFLALAIVPAGVFLPAAAALVVVGCSAGALFVLMPSLAADAIDYGAVRGLGAQGGLYMSVFSLVSKAATAAAIGVALPALQAAGFDPRAPATPEGAQALRTICLFLPCGLLAVGGVVAWTHPLSRQRHDLIVRRLERLRRRAGVAAAG
ncbi:MAG: MFS transporter [Phenylobacterium sp.]|uniref:MFS transporter n=1 Tax=Phenylobacterium sp. TaxID=1871053 RepID=UPI001A5CE72A|nr:MFS transporter [Phenylobacterium sp.]MBL8773338.1 MFS transporter [Phenylobacterium sp.]